jgi:hypothetical protein
MIDFYDLEQIDAERRRRFKATIERDLPSSGELQRMRLQFERARRASRRSISPSRGLLVGFAVLLIGATAIASATGQRWFARVFAKAPVEVHPASSTPRERVNPKPGTAAAAQPAPAAFPPATVLDPVEVVAPRVSPPRSQSFERESAVPAAPSAFASSGIAGAAAPEGPGSAWARAAAAIRRGDEAAASVAFRELERSPDASTRDAAALAWAQLEIGAGRRERALAVLARLARNGATPFVRGRAQEILGAQE